MKKITEKRIAVLLLLCFILTFVSAFISFGDESSALLSESTEKQNDNDSFAVSGELRTDENGVQFFESYFVLPDFDVNKKIAEISFNDIFFLNGKVSINGESLGSIDFSSESNGVIDISQFIVSENNFISVEIESGRTFETTDGVIVSTRDRYGISDVCFTTDIETGTVNVNVDIFAEKILESLESELVINISENGIFEDGAPASDIGVGTISKKIVLNPEDSEINEVLSIKVRDFDSSCLWSPSSPFLYELTVEFGDKEELYRFGFEEISSNIDTGYIIINDNSVFIAGVTINSNIIDALGLTEEATIRNFLVNLKESSCINTIKAENLTLPDIWYELGDEVGVWIISEFSNESFESMYSLFLERRNHVSCLYWDFAGEDEVISNEIYEFVSTISEEDTNGRSINIGIANPKGVISPVVECDVSYVGGDVTLDNLPDAAPSIITNKNLSWNIKTTRSIKLITDIGEFIMLDSEGNPTSEESKLWWERELPDSTGKQRISTFYEIINNMLHLWRVSGGYAGVIIPSSIFESAITDGVLSDNFIFSLYSSYAPVSLAFEQAKDSSGRGEVYKVEIALTSNMISDLDPVDVSFSLYANGAVIYQDVKQYDSIKKFGSGRDVVIRDFSFEMPKSIEDGTIVTVVVNCTVENTKMEISKNIVVSGGEPFEASYSRLAVIVVVASTGAIVLVAAVISFINTKRDEN